MPAPTNQLRVAGIIDQTPLSPLQTITFFLCFCVALFDGYDIGTVSSMAPLMADHFHVSVRSFGPLFSAGFIGMTIGALFIGPVADHVGRKWTIIASSLIFGLFTLLIAFAPSLQAVIALRFVAGLGLGGALPNIIALTSEYAPQRDRAFIVTLMACGIPLGGVLAPLVGSYIGPTWGWGASFILGGAVPACLCLALYALLPESLRFLVVRNRPVPRILAILRRIAPASIPADTSELSITLGNEGREPRASVWELFKDGRISATLLLWAMFFCNLLTALFIVSWLPAVLRGSGLPMSSALLLASLFSTGGLIGSPILGRLTDRHGPYVVLIAAYILAAGFAAYVGSAQGLTALSVAIFAAGFFVFGAQACIQALAAALYPTAIRSAGVGWAFGIGRLGSIAGPLLGGMMIAAQWPIPTVFVAAAIPALAAAACTGLMWLLPHPTAIPDPALSPH
jgi:MFS transporter, AAHS family, 4-hydroxybenzoate transporter